MNDRALSDQARDACRSLLDHASSLPRGGGPAWDQTLDQLGAPRLSEADRADHLKNGAPQGKGPLPIEMRRALERAVAPYANQMEDSWRGRDIVEQSMRDYIQLVKPVVSTSSIFANAMATTKTYGKTESKTSTITCPACGAPRTQGDDSLTCRYCGGELSILNTTTQ